MTTEARLEALERQLARMRWRQAACIVVAIAAIGFSCAHDAAPPTRLAFGNVTLDSSGLVIKSDQATIKLDATGLDIADAKGDGHTTVNAQAVVVESTSRKTRSTLAGTQLWLDGDTTKSTQGPHAILSATTDTVELRLDAPAHKAIVIATAAAQASVHVTNDSGDALLTTEKK